MSEKTLKAQVWATGLLTFDTKHEPGAFVVAELPADKPEGILQRWQEKLEIKCRLSKKGSRWYVGVVMDADHPGEAYEALVAWMRWLRKCNTPGLLDAPRPGADVPDVDALFGVQA
jgi:hypothetical protein